MIVGIEYKVKIIFQTHKLNNIKQYIYPTTDKHYNALLFL